MQQASLAQLNDIVEPGAASIWPPAWPVVIASAIALALVIGMCWWLWHQYRRRRPQRVALAKLQQLQRPSASDITLLCKRVALVYFPREHIANLSGKAWLQFLDADSALLADYDALLYKPGNAELISQYRQLAIVWIKNAHRHAKRRSEVNHV